MKPKHPFRCGCLLMQIYWLATSAIMIFVMPYGFFKLMFCLGDIQWVQNANCQAWMYTTLDAITAPIQVPIYAIFSVAESRGARVRIVRFKLQYGMPTALLFVMAVMDAVATLIRRRCIMLLLTRRK